MTPRELRKQLKALSGLAEVALRLAPTADYVRALSLANMDTGGKHSGNPWSFVSEPKYRARKTALWGSTYGSRPLALPPGRSPLRDAVASQPRVSGVTLTARVDHPNAKRLFKTGGVGPFGEPYPARNPYQMSAQQRAEVVRLYTTALFNAARQLRGAR